MVNQILTGQPPVAADSVPVQMRGGKYGDLIVSELQPRYYEQTYRQNKFSGANQAGQVTTVGLATTYTGFGIYNPIGSGKNLIVVKCGYAVPVAPAAAMVVGLMYAYNAAANPTGVTAITAKNDNLAGIAGSGVPFSAATISTPTLQKVLGVALTGAITTSPAGFGSFEDIEGGIIISPGGVLCYYTSTVSGAAGFFGSMSWLEQAL